MSRGPSVQSPSRDSSTCGAAFTPEFAKVYDEHFRYVWRCLRSLGVREAQLDDAIQEVFLVVQQKLDQFDGAAGLRTWLYAIALRIARRIRRQLADEARRFPNPGGLDGAGETGAPLPLALRADLRVDLEKQERLALAERALAALDDNKREVFVLSCIEGMSAPEVVRVLGVPLNTVYSRLRAARLAFAAAAKNLELSQDPPSEQPFQRGPAPPSPLAADPPPDLTPERVR